MTTGIVQDPIFIESWRGIAHVKSPQRIEVLYGMLEGDFTGRLTTLPLRPATPEERVWAVQKNYWKRN
jgi:hypothetical protein